MKVLIIVVSLISLIAFCGFFIWAIFYVTKLGKKTLNQAIEDSDPVLSPKDFEESNLELKAPQDMPECGSLHTFHDKANGTYISFWEVDELQAEKIIKEGGIWLGIIASAHPPVFLTTEKPIQPGEER